MPVNPTWEQLADHIRGQIESGELSPGDQLPSTAQLKEQHAVPASSPMPAGVYKGKAGEDAAEDRGWLLGHFKPAGDLRHSDDVEIKWGVHPPGDRRLAWAVEERRTALLVLISGRFRLDFPDGSVTLAERGDYVVWGRGVDHSWYAEVESVVLTVRWPSIPGYAVPESARPADDE